MICGFINHENDGQRQPLCTVSSLPFETALFVPRRSDFLSSTSADGNRNEKYAQNISECNPLFSLLIHVLLLQLLPLSLQQSKTKDVSPTLINDVRKSDSRKQHNWQLTFFVLSDDIHQKTNSFCMSASSYM